MNNFFKNNRGKLPSQHDELKEIASNFCDPIELASYYVEPMCQMFNIADYDEEKPTLVMQKPVFETLNSFFHSKTITPGSNQLLVVSDIGQGKTSLLVMLKFAHLTSSWPKGLDCKLLKIGKDTITDINKLSNIKNTVLLLDALDEDPEAQEGVGNRLIELLNATKDFNKIIITCRTQFAFLGKENPFDRLGTVEIDGFVCPTLYLSIFNDNLVDNYLKKRFSNSKYINTHGQKTKPEQIKYFLNKIGSLRVRPFLLAHIEDLLYAEKSDWDEDSIYSALIQSWLIREERKQLVKGATCNDLRKACEVTASYLQKNSKTYITRAELDSLISATPSIRHLKSIDVGGRSLFARNSQGNYRFAHYSIQKFFAKFDKDNQLYSEKDQNQSEIIHVIQTINIELIKYLKTHPNELHNLRPRQFEELIGEILSSFGWKVCITPSSKDGGYDVFAIVKDSANVKTSWIIECKKYAPERKIGVDIVRGLWGIKQDLRVANAMIATTSHFTKGVNEFKASRYDLELKDFEGILEWLNEYKLNPKGKLYIRDHKLILPG